jgi:hypothetical protein
MLKTFYDRSVFKRESPTVTVHEVIRWWKTRRPFFNEVVGCAGIVTCVLLIVFAAISEPIVDEAIGLPDGAVLGIGGILLYGILANVFYTSGWICELLVRAVTTTKKSALIGVKAFRAGITFSILLTLAPAVICWIAFAVAVMHGQETRTHSRITLCVFAIATGILS